MVIPVVYGGKFRNLKIQFKLLVLFLQFAFTIGRLTMIVSREDLFEDLGLEFGDDIYMITDDKPAALLVNPKAFRSFVNPLPHHVKQIKLKIKWKPQDLHKKFKYSMILKSSDESVLQHPRSSINLTDEIFVEDFKGFTIQFPCSGKKTAQVDLNFSLNYSYIGLNEPIHSLLVDIRKNCKKVVRSHSMVNKSWHNNNKTTPDKDELHMEKNLIIGLSVVFFVFLLVLVVYWARCMINKKRTKKQSIFDLDYSFKVINDALLSPEKNYTHGDLLCGDKEEVTKPIFNPKKSIHDSNKSINKSKRLHNQKQRLSNNKHSSKNDFSCVSLENIPEENAEYLSDDNQDVSESEKFLENDLEKPSSSDVATVSQLSSDCYSSIEDKSRENQGYEPSPSRKSELAVEFIYPSALDSINEDMLIRFNQKWMSDFPEWIVSEDQLIFDKRKSSNLGNTVQHAKVKCLPGSNSIITSVSLKFLKSVNPENLERHLNEAALIRDLRHDNVMSLLGIVLHTTQQPPILIEAYMQNRDLLSFLCNNRAKTRKVFESRRLVNFMKQIASGMDYLIMHGYTHNCLCAKNCMVSGDYLIKITSLQHAQHLGYSNQYKLPIDTPFRLKWAAIETFTDYICSRKTDVWSFGVTMWEILTFGGPPYKGLSNRQVEEFLLRGCRLSKPNNCSDELFELISSCWQYNPLDRPSFNSLKNMLIEFERRFSIYSIHSFNG